MTDAKSVLTPITQHFKLSSQQCPNSEEEIAYMSKVPYSNAVGSVMYSMICTMPDLAFASSLISRFMYNPGREH